MKTKIQAIIKVLDDIFRNHDDCITLTGSIYVRFSSMLYVISGLFLFLK